MAPPSLNKLASGSVYFISIARILAGSSTLFAPQLAGELFGVPINPKANVIARLFGIRDLAIGAFLWGAHGNISRAVNAPKRNEARRDVRNLLWMGMLCDSVDTCSSVVAVLTEGMQGRAFGLVGGGAALLAALAAVTLRRM